MLIVLVILKSENLKNWKVLTMKVTKSIVIDTAAQMADEKGLRSLSLKNIAGRLNIKTPSLYNHIENLDNLLLEVAHKGMRTMNARMERAAIGKSGDIAIKAVGTEYLNFILEHPGIYETIQWATWNGSSETAKIFNSYNDLLITLIRSCQLPEGAVYEVLSILTGILHGYTTLQLRVAFNNPDQIRNNLSDALDIVLLGIYQKYNACE